MYTTLEIVPAEREPIDTLDEYVTSSVDKVYVDAAAPDSDTVIVLAVCVADRFLTRNVLALEVVPRVLVPKSSAAPPSRTLLDGSQIAKPVVGVEDGAPYR